MRADDIETEGKPSSEHQRRGVAVSRTVRGCPGAGVEIAKGRDSEAGGRRERGQFEGAGE